MTKFRLASVGVCALVVAAWLDSSCARASEAFDVSYVSKDAVAALVLHPKRVLSSPDLEMLPIELLVALGLDKLGIDPTKIDEALGILSMTGLPMGQPGMGAVLRFAEPYDPALVLAKLGVNSDDATHAGKKYKKSNTPGGFSFYMPDGRTLVIGTELQLKNMLAADKVDTPLVKLLKQADTSKGALLLVDFATLRPLVQLGMQSLPPLPEQFREFLDLPKLVQWIEVSLEIQNGFDLAVVLGAADVKDAERLKNLAERAKVLAREFIDTQAVGALGASNDATEQAMAQYMRRLGNKLLDAIEIKLADKKVEIALVKGTPTIAATGVVVALMLPAVQAAREAARRNSAMNQLKQIGLALLNHENVYKSFPARAIYDKDGKPLLSWRVKILPALDEGALYKEFHLDEPWDSEHNRKLIDRMPSVYKNPNATGTNTTVYLGIAGEGNLFGQDDGLRIRQIIDGTSKTAAVVEANADRAVTWTKPDDLEVDPKNPLAGLGSLRPGGFLTVFCDAHVQFISTAVDPDVLRALFSYGGREPVGVPE